ncbi:MAG: PHP domain-containing protein [Deltaproteobacteria bacterium]|nr:PHP domain-containing protein [Deltaproteobacteria bacterium]
MDLNSTENPDRLISGRIVVEKITQRHFSVLKSAPVHPGDWMLTSPIGTLLVSGTASASGTRSTLGEIIGIWRDNTFFDNLSAVSFRPVIDGSPSQLRLAKIHPARFNGAAGLQITWNDIDNQLSQRTFISYAEQTRSFKISSRIRNTGDQTIRNVFVNTSFAGDGGFPFAPGLGFVDAESQGSAAWIAFKGQQLSTALVRSGKPYEVTFQFDPHGPYQNHARIGDWTLPAGASAIFDQHILVAEGGLEAIAHSAWQIAGVSVGRISGTALPMQSWGEISIANRTGHPVMVVDVSKGGFFEAYVPFGDYTVSLVTPGGIQGKSLQLTGDTPAADVAFSTVPPGTVHYLVFDRDMHSLPARLVIHGISPTPNPTLGPRYKASGAENIRYCGKGAGSFELPSGTYRVLVTHGPEFSIDEKIFTVQPGRHVSLQFELTEEIYRDGWLSADFHLHAEPSYDSDISLADRLISLYAENLDIAVATDHNAVTDYSIAFKDLPFSPPHVVRTVSGVEVTTKKPDWGHFNIWPWPAQESPPPWMGQTAEDIFSFSRAHHPEAIIQVNHPRMTMYDVGYFNLAGLNTTQGEFEKYGASFDFDTIEVFNGMDLNYLENVAENLEEWYRLLNQGHRYVATGNSDSHFLVGHFAGYPRNYLRIPENTAKTEPGALPTDRTIAAAVREGHLFVSNGPFLLADIGDASFGDTVSVKRNAPHPIYLEVRSPSWLPVDTAQVIVNGESVQQAALPALDETGIQTVELPLMFDKDAWVVVKVTGNCDMNRILPGSRTSPLAFGNPIWVTVHD